jgi:CHAT domain-containing protein
MLNRIVPGGLADRAGLRPGDVVLRYAGVKIVTMEDLGAALREHARDRPGKEPSLELAWWREGKKTTKVFPGLLGIGVDRRPAAEAVREARGTARALARGGGFKPLPGTRREVQAIARLFGKAEVLLGKDASEQKLEERARELKDYTHLHLATHGLADRHRPLASYLALSDRHLPDPLKRVLAGRPPYTGRLTAGDILGRWRLDADLVVLSACQSGLGRYEYGEGYVGFAQALFLAGARSLVVSQWEVDDAATALLMTRFYQNLLGKRKGLKGPMGKAEALHEAKQWLRNLSARGAKEALTRGKIVAGKLREGARPYAHPWHWAGFILVGDP